VLLAIAFFADNSTPDLLSLANCIDCYRLTGRANALGPDDELTDRRSFSNSSTFQSRYSGMRSARPINQRSRASAPTSSTVFRPRYTAFLDSPRNTFPALTATSQTNTSRLIP